MLFLIGLFFAIIKSFLETGIGKQLILLLENNENKLINNSPDIFLIASISAFEVILLPLCLTEFFLSTL